MELIRLKGADYEEAIDFLDLVFSRAHRPTRFAEILPIIYRPTDEHMSCNFAVRENGRIRGIVGLFPAEMKVGDTVLKLGGIGGVSAHPNDKGKGWMKTLMGRAIEEMENTGIDLSFLAGLRQRYQYFGYESTGNMLEYEVSQTNIRHVFRNMDTPALQLVPIENSDQAYIEKAKELHDRQPIHCVRSLDDFWLFLKAVCTTPWAAFNSDGEMVGYLVVSEDQSCITEVFAENEDTIIHMIHSWMLQQKVEELKVLLAPWQKDAARGLGTLAEEFHFTGSGNFRIFNWEKVVGSLLAVKGQSEYLQDGSLLIGIKDYGTLQIMVEDGKTTCQKVEKEAELELDSLTAMRALFGHCPIQFITETTSHVKMLMDAWFPLPLCWLVQNHV